MKKNLNRITWGLASLALFASSAFAQMVAPHWTFMDVKFRDHNSTFASQTGAFLDDGFVTTGLPNAFDSTYASGTGVFDTTVTVSTTGWSLPNRTSSAADTATICRLFIYDAGPSVGLNTVSQGRTSATAESLYIKTQVSVNNFDWQDCAIMGGASPVIAAWTNALTVNGAVIVIPSHSQNTGISGKTWGVGYNAGVQASGASRIANDINHIHEWPYVRWIISGTRATTNHALRAKVGFISASVQPFGN